MTPREQAWKREQEGRIEALEARLVTARGAAKQVLDACDQGRMVERGAGGMTIEAQIKRSVYNGVPAWPIEKAREALALLDQPSAPQPTPEEAMRCPEVRALVEAANAINYLNENYSPFGGEIYQDRIDMAWDNLRDALAALTARPE